MNDSCPMPLSSQAPADADLARLLTETKTLAVVGASPRAERTSHQVINWLLQHSHFDIVLVNPLVTRVVGAEGVAVGVEDGKRPVLADAEHPAVLGGRPFYSSLSAIPHQIDMVDIFLNESLIPPVVEEAIGIAAKSVFIQLGLVSPEACAKAELAGITTIQNRCIKVEYDRLISARNR